MKYVGEKPKRRGRYLLHFEKVGILFHPKWLAVHFDETRQQYALYYYTRHVTGHHLVRHYPTRAATIDAAKRLQARLAKLDPNLISISICPEASL